MNVFLQNLSFPQFPSRRGTERCSFKGFEFDFKVGHSKNIFNNYSCSPPPTPFLYLLFFSPKSACCRSARAETRWFFCQILIWWNVGVTNCFVLGKRLHSAGDNHLVPVLPSAPAVVVFIIEWFDAEAGILCRMRRRDAVIDVSLGQQSTLFRQHWVDVASMLSPCVRRRISMWLVREWMVQHCSIWEPVSPLPVGLNWTSSN